MPRVYSAGKVEASRIADGDVLNANYKIALETLNGQLDAHSIPMQGFGESSLVDGVTSAAGIKQQTIGAVNDYYLCTSNTTQTYTECADTSWYAVRLSSSPVVAMNSVISGPACVMVGAAQVSGKRIGKTDATTSARFGEESTWELGVFVDGNLIAETGEIPAGIYTPHLPFSTQLSSGVHIIEVRFRQTLRPISALEDHEIFESLSAHMWIRCQKR